MWHVQGIRERERFINLSFWSNKKTTILNGYCNVQPHLGIGYPQKNTKPKAVRVAELRCIN